MWPALAGIGSLLGEGTAGFFVDAANRATPWGYAKGEAWLDKPEAGGIEHSTCVAAYSVRSCCGQVVTTLCRHDGHFITVWHVRRL